MAVKQVQHLVPHHISKRQKVFAEAKAACQGHGQAAYAWFLGSLEGFSDKRVKRRPA